MTSEDRQKILMIAANQGVSPVTGQPVGFWFSEMSHPYFTFTEAGYVVDLVSPNGGDLEADAFSDPEHESGYSAHDFVSLGFKKSPTHQTLLKDTKSVYEMTMTDYAGIFVVGGQSPMVTMVDDEKLQRFISNAYESGRPVALVCHAAALLLKTKRADGELLVDGKSWTGFTDAEEAYVEQAVGGKVQPFWIETEANKLPNTTFVAGPPLTPHAIRDGLLITGQQQVSGVAAARELMAAIG